MKGQPHSAEAKAAVLAALLAGQSVADVARTHRIAEGTIRTWREAAGLTGSRPVDPQKQADIGALVLDYLHETFRTLSAQQRHFGQSGWLDKQNAADLAVLHGVSADKAYRLLAALEPAEPAEPDASGAGD